MLVQDRVPRRHQSLEHIFASKGHLHYSQHSTLGHFLFIKGDEPYNSPNRVGVQSEADRSGIILWLANQWP